MDPSCSVYVGAVYKLDDGLPNSITCTITAEDSGGNVNSTTLIISIGNVFFKYLSILDFQPGRKKSFYVRKNNSQNHHVKKLCP